MLEQKIKRDAFDNILSQLREAIRYYDSRYYNSKTYSLFLANGDKINYSIPENAIAHLLGVNTNYLNSTSVLTPENTSSIGILREFCKEENSYMLYKRINEGILDIDQLFSKHIEEKINVFANNIQPIIFDMEFVCKIDRNKIHNQGMDYMNIDYLVCSKDQQGRYLVLGLVNNGDTHVARTSMIFETEEEMVQYLKDILLDQELTFATGLRITNTSELDYKYKPIYLNLTDKKEKINSLISYKKIFSANIDISQDYNFILSQHQNQYNIGKEIVELMKRGELIDLDELSMRYHVIPDTLRIIVEEYNNSLCVGGNSIANEKYSELDKEARELREKIRELREEKQKLEDDNSALMEQLTTARTENEELSSCFEEIQKTLSKVKK